METNVPKMEWEHRWNKAYGSCPINDEYHVEYMFLNHDFGYGAYFRCFRIILKADEDIDKVGFDEAREIGEGMHTEEEARYFCEKDLIELLEECKTATNILHL